MHHFSSTYIHPRGRRRFVFADDLASTTKRTDYATIEEALTSALDGLSVYYTTKQIRPNPKKTQVSSLFQHAESRMWQTAQHQLERFERNPRQPPGVSWRHTELNVGMHISRRPKRKSEQDATSSATKNLALGSHSNHTQVVISSAVLLSRRVFSPVCERSTHANKLDATLSETCRMITGCQKSTNTNSLHVLAGFA